MKNKKGFWQIIDKKKNIPIELTFDVGFDDDGDECKEVKQFFTKFEILCFCKRRIDTELLNYEFKQI